MSRSILCARSTSRLLSISPSTTASSLRPSSYCLLRTSTHSVRQISSTSQNPSQKSFSDRGLVIGLLTLTTLIGFGFGTRSKSTAPQLEQNPPSKESNTLKTDPVEGNSLDNENSENKQTGEGSDNESEQGGAFNPETGEINWDCPCLGGMAHGTCGEQFKAAFSCFVYSEQEPKGVECIEKFKLMQDCFKDHPDEYGPELADTDDPTNEEKGDLPPDSSDGEGNFTPNESQSGSQDRELTPNPPSSPSNQDDEPVDRPPASLSQGAPAHEISSNAPDSNLLRPIDVKSSPLSG